MYVIHTVHTQEGVPGKVMEEIQKIITVVREDDVGTLKALLQGSYPEDLEDEDGKSLLRHAIEAGSCTTLQYILRIGANFSSLDILVAVQSRQLQSLKIGLQYWCSSAQELKEGFFLACKEGLVDFIIEFFRLSSFVSEQVYNMKDAEKKTALMLAAEHGQEEIVRLLLKHNVSVNEVCSEGKSALIYALPHAGIVDLLLPFTGQGIEMALDLARSMGVEKTCELLSQSQASQENGGSSADGSTPLMWGIHKGELDVVKDLISTRPDLINIRNATGLTALQIAAEKGLVEICRELINAGADLSAKDADGEDSLFFASANGNEEVLLLLLDHGADVNSRNNHGESCLHAGCSNAHASVVEKLLQHKAKTNIRNNAAETPLMYAAFTPNVPEILHLLLHNTHHDPADVNAISDQSKSALFIAVENGMVSTVRTLVDSNARLDIAYDELGAIPLHAAVMLAGNNGAAALPIAQMLLERDKSVQLTYKNRDDQTPLALSESLGYDEMSELLRQAMSPSELPLPRLPPSQPLEPTTAKTNKRREPASSAAPSLSGRHGGQESDGEDGEEDSAKEEEEVNKQQQEQEQLTLPQEDGQVEDGNHTEDSLLQTGEGVSNGFASSSHSANSGTKIRKKGKRRVGFGMDVEMGDEDEEDTEQPETVPPEGENMMIEEQEHSPRENDIIDLVSDNEGNHEDEEHVLGASTSVNEGQRSPVNEVEAEGKNASHPSENAFSSSPSSSALTEAGAGATPMSKEEHISSLRSRLMLTLQEMDSCKKERERLQKVNERLTMKNEQLEADLTKFREAVVRLLPVVTDMTTFCHLDERKGEDEEDQESGPPRKKAKAAL